LPNVGRFLSNMTIFFSGMEKLFNKFLLKFLEKNSSENFFIFLFGKSIKGLFFFEMRLLQNKKAGIPEIRKKSRSTLFKKNFLNKN